LCQWSRRAGEAQNVSGEEREVAWADFWGWGGIEEDRGGKMGNGWFGMSMEYG
jgi:hypothetical protein